MVLDVCNKWTDKMKEIDASDPSLTKLVRKVLGTRDVILKVLIRVGNLGDLSIGTLMKTLENPEELL